MSPRGRHTNASGGLNNSVGIFSVAAPAFVSLFVFRRRFFRSRSSSKRKKDNDNDSSSAGNSPNSSVSLSSDVLLEDASTAASLAILEREKEKDVEIYLQFKAFCEDDNNNNNNNKARAAQSNQTNQMSTDESSPPASPIMMGASSSAAVNILPLARFLQEEMCHDEWRGATEHAFVRAMLRHELPKNSMAVYLVQDYRFLDSFSRLLAAVLCNAAVNLQERRFGASFLALILSDENDYFVQSFKALGVPADERTRKKKFPDQPAADAFISAMDDAADNAAQKPHVAVALLLVCEWAYQTWAEEALAVAVKRTEDGMYPLGFSKALPLYVSRWVDLHSGPDFARVVTYFQDLLGAVCFRWSEDEAPTLLAETISTFRATCHLEKGFWDMAWEFAKVSYTRRPPKQ